MEQNTEPVQIVHERIIERPIDQEERIREIERRIEEARYQEPVIDTLIEAARIIIEGGNEPGPKPPVWNVREPEVEPKTIRETIPEPEQKQFTEQFGNNSPNNSDSELLEPPEPAPQAGSGGYKKKGIVGRKRKYEEPGINGEIPVKKVVLYRHIKGRHWPGMSQDMQEWYDRYYFTKPKRTGKGADHARHIRSYERGQRWIAEHEGRAYQPGTVGHSGKIVAYRKRATN